MLPFQREDPVQIKIDYAKWAVHEAKGRDEEVNIFGVKTTRATPAGFTALPDSALPDWKQGQSSLFANERDIMSQVSLHTFLIVKQHVISLGFQAKNLPAYAHPPPAAAASYQHDESDWEKLSFSCCCSATLGQSGCSSPTSGTPQFGRLE